jgi:hypothetical protein
MIRMVGGRLMRERPDLFVLTLHDCLAVAESDADYVEQIIRLEFLALGLQVKLKRETCE